LGSVGIADCSCSCCLAVRWPKPKPLALTAVGRWPLAVGRGARSARAGRGGAGAPGVPGPGGAVRRGAVDLNPNLGPGGSSRREPQAANPATGDSRFGDRRALTQGRGAVVCGCSLERGGDVNALAHYLRMGLGTWL
jgi:hypothetical protein